MIVPGSYLRGCAGSFDTTVSSRPLSAFIPFTSQPPGSTNEYFHRYQPSGAGTNFALKVPPRVAPYSTQEWLVRNSALPLFGQTPVDTDGVFGFVLNADRGWARTGKLIRAPKSLVIVGDVVGDEFLAAVTAAYGPLNDLNVDVYFTTLPARFSSALALQSVTFYGALSDTGGGAQNQVGLVSPADPTDLDGARVMYAALTGQVTGYQLTLADRFGTGTTGEHPGYVWRFSQNQGGGVPAFVAPFEDLGNANFPPFDTYQVGYSAIAAGEASYLIAVAARCAGFRFDVYGNDIDPGPPSLPYPTLAEAEALFRNGVPGSGYAYTFDGSDWTPGVSTLVDNAVAFFS